MWNDLLRNTAWEVNDINETKCVVVGRPGTKLCCLIMCIFLKKNIHIWTTIPKRLYEIEDGNMATMSKVRSIPWLLIRNDSGELKHIREHARYYGDKNCSCKERCEYFVLRVYKSGRYRIMPWRERWFHPVYKVVDAFESIKANLSKMPLGERDNFYRDELCTQTWS